MHDTVLGDHVRNLKKQFEDLSHQLEEASVELDERNKKVVPSDIMEQLHNRASVFSKMLTEPFLHKDITIENAAIHLKLCGNIFYVSAVDGGDIRKMMQNCKDDDVRGALNRKSDELKEFCKDVHSAAERYGVHLTSLWASLDRSFFIRSGMTYADWH